MKTELTTTTGKVEGREAIGLFLAQCGTVYDEIQYEDVSDDYNFLQYTILTQNRIRIYLSKV